jgi:hypothetical protein
MVTPDEQRTIQLTNAESDERFWSNLHNMHAGTVAGQKALIATAEKAIACGAAEIAKADTNAKTARERVERLKKGESVDGGLGRPFDLRRMLIAAGFAERDVRRMQQIGELDEAGLQELQQEVSERRERSERAALRAVRKRHGLG